MQKYHFRIVKMNDVFSYYVMTTFSVLMDSPEGFVKVTLPQGT